MGKNLLRKIVVDEDLKETGFNMASAWLFGNVANIISNAVFHFNLNQYNSVTHFVGGVGIGTFAYRKAGGGLKGILAGLTAATLFNVAWEGIENKYIFRSNPFTEEQSAIDIFSDISIVYAGTALSALTEKLKGYKGRSEKYPNRKEKWVL